MVVVANMPMGAPGTIGNAPLMMSTEVSELADKTKRVLFGNPGKPLRGIRLEGEHALFGTDHDGAPLRVILDARDDVGWFGGCFSGGRGGGTRTGSRGWRFG